MTIKFNELTPLVVQKISGTALTNLNYLNCKKLNSLLFSSRNIEKTAIIPTANLTDFNLIETRLEQSVKVECGFRVKNQESGAKILRRSLSGPILALDS